MVGLDLWVVVVDAQVVVVVLEVGFVEVEAEVELKNLDRLLLWDYSFFKCCGS